MRTLLVLLTLVAAAPTAAALGLPALTELALPSLVEFAPQDAGAEVATASPAAAAEKAAAEKAAKARPARTVAREYVVIDIERRGLAAPAPAGSVASIQDAPMTHRIATVELVIPRAEDPMLAEPVIVRRAPAPAEVAPQSASVEPAAAALAAVTLASLGAGVVLHGAVAMYHRIAPAQALAHGTRARVHAEVVRRGGASAGEIAEALDLHPKTARYHLDLLAGFHLLVRDPDGAYRAPGVKREALPTLEEAILELVEVRPGLNMAEVARELGVGKSTAQEHVTRLLIEGRLESRREERSRALFPRVAVTA